MPRPVGERIFGLETEFGCLVDSASATPETAVELIKDHVFSDLKLGVLDYHARDEVFEPAQSGGFLMNGARLYIDAVGSHLEYATAECRNLDSLIANDRAGQRIIVQAIHELGLSEEVSVYNNSVDHFGGHTFGCHENYLVEMTEDFFTSRVQQLYAFLVTRQIFAGVGRVGGHILYEGGRPTLHEMSENPIDYIWVSQVYHVYPDERVLYQLSQRADHIIRTIASRVRFNRAIINPKWEHFYAHDGMHRLHILYGESNQSEYAYKLKVGTTNLVLRLLEDGLLDDMPQIEQPLIALRDISRDESYQWVCGMEDGTTATALEIQRRHRDLAERYRGHSPDTDWVLDEWDSVLTALAGNPMELADRLDWVAKRSIVDMYREDMGLEWTDDALHSIDLEYHNIDPTKSLFHALPMRRVVDEVAIIDSQTDPPTDTRALGRGRLVKQAIKSKTKQYTFDWSAVSMGRLDYNELPDPFLTYEEIAES